MSNLSLKERMKDSRFHISLYIIIPAIFAGYAFLSALLAFQLTRYCLKFGLNLNLPLAWSLLIIVLVGFVCGFIIVWVMLRPLKEFIISARSVLPDADTENKRADQIEDWEHFFKRVTTVLSMVDARNLFPKVVAESEAMRAVLSQVTRVAPTDSTVLILGESGTGKELISTSLYEQSKRMGNPFIKLNCVAIPDGLWESELFGHEKGAFTGATERKIGKFELANNGTLFLDEIGDMPLATQAKMLRVLQEREFERVGGTKTIRVDVRFIAATNKNLEKMVSEKTFREDLFFRLNVFVIYLPPLRERREDIPILTEHFCEKMNRKLTIAPMVYQILKENYDWPGNVRELENVIERAGVMCDGDMIEPHHLPERIVGSGLIVPSDLTIDDDQEADSGHGGKRRHSLSMDEQLNEMEKSMIIEALRKAQGIQVKAARLLGIKERSLWHRIKKHDIDARTFRKG